MVRLNDDQLKQLAEFASNLGLVLFATVIAPVFCLFLSLIILRSPNYDKS